MNKQLFSLTLLLLVSSSLCLSATTKLAYVHPNPTQTTISKPQVSWKGVLVRSFIKSLIALGSFMLTVNLCILFKVKENKGNPLIFCIFLLSEGMSAYVLFRSLDGQATSKKSFSWSICKRSVLSMIVSVIVLRFIIFVWKNYLQPSDEHSGIKERLKGIISIPLFILLDTLATYLIFQGLRHKAPMPKEVKKEVMPIS